MCTAVALGWAGLALGAASAGAQAIGQRQQARAQYQAQLQQNEMQRRMQAQAAAAERQRALQEQTSLRMRQAQEQEAVGRELEQVSRKSQAALARARVSAGEAGVAGASVDALMGDYLRQEAGYRSALLRQQELSGIGTGLGLEQIGLASQQRLIGINQPIAEPARPRGLGIQDVLSVASGGLQGYMAGRSLSGGSSNPKSEFMQSYTEAPTKLGQSNLTLSGGYYTGFNPR
jgi:hypothetical protein